MLRSVDRCLFLDFGVFRTRWLFPGNGCLLGSFTRFIVIFSPLISSLQLLLFSEAENYRISTHKDTDTWRGRLLNCFCGFLFETLIEDLRLPCFVRSILCFKNETWIKVARNRSY
eukprot:Gregarina_sp_Poly_1__578@NODE_1137_length_4975_cov_105_293602_g667_i2_p8_GENE_NODE_1137_length_4975_cov_105_293602_g667_i2NODE_1137_length_4975_cov_105_293602_g667_i2_p8_ORF_typecomplete_len115_score1_56_NODE_1137_length_4975_cov_105_293602_g667_i27431087